jgi:hypothetical protein
MVKALAVKVPAAATRKTRTAKALAGVLSEGPYA